MQRTNNSVWSNGWISPDFNQRSIKTSWNWQDSFTRNLSWVCIGRSYVTTSVVITMNFEFNSMCRRKKHSLFHWNALMLPGPLILIWTCCKESVLMTVGMSIRAEVCQILREESQKPLYWKKNLPEDTCGSVRDWQNLKTGKTRSQNSTLLDNWEESTLLIRMTKNTRKTRKMWGDAAMPCKNEILSCTRKLVAELNASHKVPKKKLWMKSGISWIHKEATSGTYST